MEAVPQRRRHPLKSVTIADVARRAGVGAGTVSRVLNDSASVSDPTRRRVLEVIAELDYRPSRLARSLSLGRTQMIAMVCPFVTEPSGVERLRGFIPALTHSRYDVVLFDVETVEQRDEQLRRLSTGGDADGVAVVSLPLRDDEVRRFADAGLPLVLLDVAHPLVPHIVVDDVAGGEIATRHLLALGHRRIAFVGDPPTNPYGFTSSLRRCSGWRLALAAAGVAVSDELLREGPHGRDAARALAAGLLAQPDPPTAIIAASDTQALGVLEAARDAGLDVPGALSVVGYDDIEAAAYVGLTTVRQPLRESGARAAALLLRAVGGEAVPAVGEQLELELVVRATTGPGPGR